MNMSFGKHKGTPLDEVPEDYLVWVLDNCTNASPTLLAEIKRVLGLEERPPPPPPPPRPPPPGGVPLSRVRALLLEALRQWHRKQAMRHHPDRGGKLEVAQAINDVADQLTREITAVFDAAEH